MFALSVREIQLHVRDKEPSYITYTKLIHSSFFIHSFLSWSSLIHSFDCSLKSILFAHLHIQSLINSLFHSYMWWTWTWNVHSFIFVCSFCLPNHSSTDYFFNHSFINPSISCSHSFIPSHREIAFLLFMRLPVVTMWYCKAISLRFSTGGQLVLAGGQNFLSCASL